MNLIKKFFARYKGTLRSWKWVYILNNLFQFRKLKHNQRMIDRLNLDHNAFSSIGTKDLPTSECLPWLDEEGGVEKMKADPRFEVFPEAIQQGLYNYIENGFMVIPAHYSTEAVKQHNDQIDSMLADDEIFTNYGGTKLMHVFEASPWIDQEFFRNPMIIEVLSFIFDRKVIPFQTIHFLKGSEQRAHSDSIHMSTYPPGYLAGVWTALEDIDIDQGPLFYYPGSHRWPYVSCEDYTSGNTKWRLGETSYLRYEDYIEGLISESELEKVTYLPKAGDVLIWHANLIHGGSPMKDPQKSRRSMVGHYYADEVFCYHEISQRPALITT